jgi:glutaredoxin-related protein
MNASTDLTWLFGIVISILLSMVVYFVRLLHVDFRRMQKDIAEVKTTTQLIKSEFKGGLELINQRVGQLEVKVKQFETIFYNSIKYEKE